MRRFIVPMLPLLLAACQGTSSLPASSRVPTIADIARMPERHATFSKPAVPAAKGPPAVTWIFASNGEGGNVDVYSAATLKMISTCPCTGVGLAVDPGSGDLAVGARSDAVTVWHVKGTGITQYSTLQLSQGPYAIGIAFDRNGDVYAANASDNVIDFFSAAEIAAGGGSPTRTLFTSHLNEAEYLAFGGGSLLADGYDQNGQAILVSVDTRKGADTILQSIPSGMLPEGIVFDRQQNLIVNTVGNTNLLAVYAKPWTGTATSTLVYGSGSGNSYYTGISLNKAQNTLWAANFDIPAIVQGFANIQANSYPLGTVGKSSFRIASEFYDSIAVDPQAKL